MKTGFSLCGKTTQGKPCSGPVLALYGIAVQATRYPFTQFSFYVVKILNVITLATLFADVQRIFLPDNRKGLALLY